MRGGLLAAHDHALVRRDDHEQRGGLAGRRGTPAAGGSVDRPRPTAPDLDRLAAGCCSRSSLSWRCGSRGSRDPRQMRSRAGERVEL